MLKHRRPFLRFLPLVLLGLLLSSMIPRGVMASAQPGSFGFILCTGMVPATADARIAARPELATLVAAYRASRTDQDAPGKNSDGKTQPAAQLCPHATAHDLADASRIVKKLDGIPMSIELAGSQRSIVTATAMIHQLSRPVYVFKKPATGARGKAQVGRAQGGGRG
mgnify:CR=1 FL=1